MSQDPNVSNANPVPSYEELQVVGEQLLTKIKELLHEGNVRRIIIKQEGHTILEIPLTVGVVGVIAVPMLAAIGAIGALIANCSIEIVRSERPSDAVKDAVNNVVEKVDNATPYNGPAL